MLQSDAAHNGRNALQSPDTSNQKKELNPPNPPADAGGKKPARKSRPQVTFPTWVDACHESGEKPIPADDPIFRYADDTGIPLDFIRLAWWSFSRKHRESGRRQRDWRAHFRDAVRGNWSKLWWMPPEGGCQLSTVGVAAQRERDAELARRAADEQREAG
jgi:hypothetical protein